MITRLQTGVTRFETSGDTDVVITRVIDAPRELAFDLWTKPVHLQRWMTEGEDREVVPPERLVHAERWGPEWPETTNTLVFTEQDDQTVMVLTVA